MRLGGRLVPAALAFALAALGGCDRATERATGEAGGLAGPDQAAAEYETCRSGAAGDPQALVACADTVVLAAAPAAGREAFARLGDAALAEAGGDQLALRAGVADALARFALERAALRQGRALARADEAPVPAPLARAGATLVAGTCGAARALQACEMGRDRLLPRLAARVNALAAPGEDAGAKPAALGGYRPPGCDPVRAAPSAEAALAQFESEFPAALKDERLVETVAPDDGQVRAIAAYLACLAARTDYAPDVVESSLTLFASERNGTRMRDALARLGKGGGDDAAAAREFGAQVEDYLAAPAG